MCVCMSACKQGVTPLLEAVQREHYEVVKALMDAGAFVDHKTVKTHARAPPCLAGA